MTLEHHQIIPYDIVYKVYFYINDYCTLTKFWGLCKPFYKHYMKKYKQSYKHKYNIIYNDLFFFLSLLPDTDYANINSNNSIQYTPGLGRFINQNVRNGGYKTKHWVNQQTDLRWKELYDRSI